MCFDSHGKNDAIVFKGRNMMTISTQNTTAYEHYVKGRELFRTFTRAGVTAAKSEFSEAIGLDPGLARAYGWLGYVHLEEIQEGWTTDVENSFTSAVELASKGVELAPDDYYTHWNLATIFAGQKETSQAQDEFDRALALNPNEPDLLADIADMLSYQGEPESAIEHMERAMNLKIPQWYYWSLGFAYFQKRQYDEAVTALEKMSDPPNTAYLLLVACKAELGKRTTPEAIMERLLSKDPQWTPDHLDRFPFAKPEDHQHYLDTFKRAGIPVPG
jgi:tetratricopeptide (TPR) repeat protein